VGEPGEGRAASGTGCRLGPDLVALRGGVAPGRVHLPAWRLGGLRRARFPDLAVRGVACPPRGFERDPRDVEAIARRVAACSPDIVFIGLPLNKHLVMGRSLRRLAPDAWLVGVGVSFSFVSGDIRRAPRWVQRAGLEWAHRLAQEPRRLFRRYVVEGIPFAARLLAYSALARALSALAMRPDRVEPRRRRRMRS
jgi:hypothetical protein